MRFPPPVPPWLARHRRKGALLLLAAVIGATGIASGARFSTAEADQSRAGVTVPADLVGVLAQAALSCPTLTPARLAGQLMAASGFASGTDGIAGFDVAEWEQWRPWPGAEQTDPKANVVALAHHMCDLAGSLREANIDGELWTLSLAAHDQGLSGVVAARAVPAAAEAYVAEVTGYADWYTSNTDFGASEAPSGAAPSAAADAVAPQPVPAAYVELISAAGRTCEQISPAKLAGQLMAASAFNPDLLGDDGGQGIAQFLPGVWERYGAEGQSPWKPADAVPALARAMCGLTTDLSGLARDPYPAALAAVEWGPAALDGPDDATIRAYADRVLAYAAYYSQDKRLAGTATGGGATPAPHPSAATGSSPAPDRSSRPAAAPKSSTPAPKATTGSSTAAARLTGDQIYGYADKCLYAPSAAEWQQLAIRTCSSSAADQRWTLTGGTVRQGSLCMDLDAGATANGTKVQLFTCNGSDAQKFTLNGNHDLVNTAYDKCVDVAEWNRSDGAVLQLWDCNGGGNQKWFLRG